MKVVHIVRQFAPSVGGLEDMVLNLCREQRIAGCGAHVVTLDRVFHTAGTRLAAIETMQGVPVTRIRHWGSSRYPLAPSVLAHVNAADIVHVHAVDFFYDFLAWTKPIHRKPLIATTHGGFFHTSSALRAKRVYFHTVTRLSSLFYDKIVACSDSDAAMFRQIIRRPVTVIENGVNLKKLGARASKSPQRTIIYFGRISSNKRIDMLFPILSELNGTKPWRLIIAGRPFDVSFGTLVGEAKKHGVLEQVTLYDSPTDEELARIVGQATYFASPSAYEGFGITAVEAMSAGLVPILSDIAPFRKLLVRGGAGIALNFAREPRSLAESVSALDRTVRVQFETLKHQLVQAAEGYGWAEVAKAYFDGYKAAGANHETS